MSPWKLFVIVLTLFGSALAHAVDVQELIDVDLPEFRADQPSYLYAKGANADGKAVFFRFRQTKQSFDLYGEKMFWNGMFTGNCTSKMAKSLKVNCTQLPRGIVEEVSEGDYEFAKGILILKRKMVNYEGVNPELRVHDFKLKQLSEYVLAQIDQCQGWAQSSYGDRQSQLTLGKAWFAENFKDLSTIRISPRRLQNLTRGKARQQVVQEAYNLSIRTAPSEASLVELGAEAVARSEALLNRQVTEWVSLEQFSDYVTEFCQP